MPHKKPRRKTRNAKKSRALSILSAIANGSLKIATVFIAGSAPLPRSREIRRWQYEVLRWEPNIDIEKMIRDAKSRGYTNRKIKEIQKRRWARLMKKGGRLVLEITEEGKKRLVQYELDTLSISIPKQWDGQWHILLFDIPERERAGRDILRDRLKRLGFLRLQQSAFVYPYSCEDQLDILIQHYGLQPYVTFFTAKTLGYQEVKAREYFDL